ncbi:lectin-like domain-containing protein [Virgibacillus sp. W0430]|uniref:lectin-like domain-containing protein n=1 Tax=Virgibacillus sp. W0430 TaxID=3391580 RepID=UPI003F4797CE
MSLKESKIKLVHKQLSVIMAICLLFSFMPPKKTEAAAVQPISIAQGDTSLGFNNGFDQSFWSVGDDAVMNSSGGILTPASGGKKGYMYFKDSLHLQENLSFNTKFSFKINNTGNTGGDGLAFVMQTNSNTAGGYGEGLGYSGISPSLAVEIDTYYNSSANDPYKSGDNSSHIAITLNGDYKEHLALKDLYSDENILLDYTNKTYSVWIDYNGNKMDVYFAEDETGNANKPTQTALSYNVNLGEVFGSVSDVFVGFSASTGWAYSKHEIRGVLFDSSYSDRGLEPNEHYKQETKPNAPSPLQVTKDHNSAYEVTPEPGSYVFYENENDVKSIHSGNSFLIDAAMNTDGKKYYYTLVKNGIQSERSPIEVTVVPVPEPAVYPLTVNSGSGAGAYEAGKNITIEANQAPEGKQFKRWIVMSETVALENSQSATTSFIMPEEAVEITAIYEDIPLPTYKVTVNNGSENGAYEAGKNVTIEADQAPEGKQFKGWIVISGTVALENSQSAMTSFIMPEEAVEITAIYEDIPTVDNGHISKEAKNADGAPKIKLNNDTDQLKNILLTDQEKERMKNSEDVKIQLMISDIDNTISKEEKQLIENALNGYKVAQYLDISLFKLIGNDNPISVTKVSNMIQITIDIPEYMLSEGSSTNREFMIVKVHDGKLQVLKDINTNDKTITFETDEFSTYSIIYADKDTTSSNEESTQEEKSDLTEDNEQTITQSTKDDNSNKDDQEGKLPNTSTSMANIMLTGLILSMIGGLLFLLNRKRVFIKK